MRKKLSQLSGKYDFYGKNFCELLACAANGCHAPKFCRENFCEYLESFLPQKFPAV